MSPIRTSIRLLLALVIALAVAMPVLAAETPLVEGTHYQRIQNGAPFRPTTDKIELVEVFSYQCNHCRDFEPSMTAFAANLPKDVVVRYVPASFVSSWEPYARAYEIAKVLKVDKRSHSAVFKALHDTRTLPRNNPSPDEIAAFYKQFGVVPSKFVALYSSPAIDKAIAANESWIMASGVQGTPTLIVNGKFVPMGRSHAEILRNAAALIRQVRNGTVR